MSTTIDQAFITQYEDEVHNAYQQIGSKLRNVVRLKTNIKGSIVQFPIYGKGLAQQKSRHGDIPVMNAAHTNASATMEDWYGADYIDDLDEIKTNIDERSAATNAGANALGRKIDSLIIAAARLNLDSGQKIAVSTTGLVKVKILEAFEILNNADVPDDGQRVAVIGAHQWNELLNLTEFKSADYVGSSDLPWLSGTQAKRWMNTLWLMSSQLPLESTTRYVLLFHKSAIGLGEGKSVTTTIERVAQKDSWLASSKLSAGAKRIDDEGVIEIACVDAATIT
jgi:hypothetical protein